MGLGCLGSRGQGVQSVALVSGWALNCFSPVRGRIARPVSIPVGMNTCDPQ